MKLKRAYLVLTILFVVVLGLLAYAIQADRSPAAAVVPKTVLSGTVSSVQQNSNFSAMFFLDLKTRTVSGAPVYNSTGSISLCRIPPCTYSTSLFSGDTYNATIEVIITTSIGPLSQDCPATPSPFTPTGTAETLDFTCNTTYPRR